jgi:hypothetical protein
MTPENRQENLVTQARELDQQIRAKLKEVECPLIDLGRLMTQMRESGLWKYLPGRHRGWEDYVNGVMGLRARSSLHEIVAAYSLTQGAQPISPEVVNRMGIKRAAQLARLKPEDRTPATINAAITRTVDSFKQVVQNKAERRLARRRTEANVATVQHQPSQRNRRFRGRADRDRHVYARRQRWRLHGHKATEILLRHLLVGHAATRGGNGRGAQAQEGCGGTEWFASA